MTEQGHRPEGTDEAPLTTHVYDGIMEHDNPIPGWWSVLWFGSIIFSICYGVVYHMSPMVMKPEQRWAAQKYEALEQKYASIADIPLSDEKMLMLMNDPEWHETGASLFRRCVLCHGENGEGFVGPNMTDDSYKNIKTLTDFFDVIKNGAAGGAMPAQTGLSDSQITVVAAYMASLRGLNLESPRPAEGEVIPPWPDHTPAEPDVGDPTAGGT